MRGLICRSLRLELVAGLGFALAIPALSVVTANAQGLATQTTLTAETRNLAGRTQSTVSIAVTGEDGLPATGAVTIEDHGKPLAGVALSAEGQASTVLALSGGAHSLRAVYAGDVAHLTSTSLLTGVNAVSNTNPSFAVSVAPIAPATLPLTLTAGTSGSVDVTVTPSNNASLTTPIFVTLSCSGLPDQASCSFTPENLEIQAGTTTLNSVMLIATQAASATATAPRSASPIAWAFLLPGVVGLGGLAFSGRHRRWLSRLSLVALVGIVTMMGTTGCNPRYNYEHHGPSPNPATPAGTYTVTVTAQSNNGVTATTENTTMALTVK